LQVGDLSVTRSQRDVARWRVSPIRFSNRMKMSKPILCSIAALSLISLLSTGCKTVAPNDESLEKRFYKERGALERLVTMMNEDARIIRVDSDFIGRRDNRAWPRPESEWGISAKRWDDYRKIFRQTGFKEGTSRAAGSDDILVIVYTEGLVTSGSAISYLHCGLKTDQETYVAPPCAERKASGSGKYGGSTSYGYRYKKLTDDWYIYEQSN
jgi:hypothetical protein